ncbi:MAG TPA: DivIVA domain-containing protein [Actinomycetota bacterium]|nr:DivIVA domain-containing protein [Actinomycetota bacterium]
MTPREIQEKQFHDAFRGYNHEEVDLFIDQVAEAYETIFKENQTFNRRLEELREQLNNAPAAAPAAAAAAAPAQGIPAVRSESEDMLKRMLVTAQETADKAVANARAKAQMLVDEAEIKARRIEEQADSVSSTTLQDAQRRARDLLTTAQQEEAELRDRIEGMRAFEREFRARLSAFIRSQLELLETKPLISTTTPGPVTSPFFDRSKLLSETIEKFGDYGLQRSAASSAPALEATPPADAPAAEAPVDEAPGAPEPQPETVASTPDWLSDPESSLDSSITDEPPSWSSEPAPSEPVEPGVPVGAAPSEEGDKASKKAPSSETKSIHELFWGED